MAKRVAIPRGLEVIASQAFYSSTTDGSLALLALARMLQEIEDGTLKEDQAKDLLEDPARVTAYIKDTPPLTSIPDAKAMAQSLMRVQRAIVSVHLHLHGMDMDLEQTHNDFERAHSDLEKTLAALEATQSKIDKLDTTLGTIATNIEGEVIAGVRKLNSNTAVKTAVAVSLIVGSVSCLVTDFLYERFHNVVEPFLPAKTVTQSFRDCKQATTLPDGTVIYVCPPNAAKPDTVSKVDTSQPQPILPQFMGGRRSAPRPNDRPRAP